MCVEASRHFSTSNRL